MAFPSITQAELKELLHYDPATGIFIYATRRVGRGAFGAVAGAVKKSGYTEIVLNGKNYQAHRLAWMYMYGEFPPAQIDHIDQRKGNNSIFNLRPATRSENLQNVGRRRDNHSGHKGVSWHTKTGKWQARIRINNVRLYLGVFTELADAAAAYAAAAARLHPYRPA